MTPWHNERWACTPTNDGRNFAPEHRWRIMPARPLCYAVKGGHDFKNKHGYPCYSCVYYRDNRMPNYAFEKRWISFEYCEQNDLIDDDEFESWNGDCVYARAHERIADYRYAQAALRAYIREAHELREENDKLKSKLHRIERRPPSYPYDIDIERLGRKLEYYFEKTDMLSALVAASKQRIATLEAENAALRGKQPRCPDCGHRLDTEECGCGGDA